MKRFRKPAAALLTFTLMLTLLMSTAAFATSQDASGDARTAVTAEEAASEEDVITVETADDAEASSAALEEPAAAAAEEASDDVSEELASDETDSSEAVAEETSAGSDTGEDASAPDQAAEEVQEESGIAEEEADGTAGEEIAAEETVSDEALAESTSDAVCKIGDTEYTSLSAAVSAASDGDTITLTAASSVSSQIQISGKSITLDLNGQTLTLGDSTNTSNDSTGSARMLYVSSGAGLTVTDSGSGGTIKNTGHSYGLIDVYGTLVIESGSFVDQGTGDGAAIRGRSGGSITIKGGTFSVSYTSYNGNSGSTYAANYYGNFVVNASYSCVSITGGTYQVGQYCWGAIKLTGCCDPDGADTVTVSGVTIATTYDSVGIECCATDTTISGCTVTVQNESPIAGSPAAAVGVNSGSTVTIESGIYTGPYAVYVYNSGGTAIINGGTFSGSVAVLKADTDIVQTYDSTYASLEGSTIIVRDGDFTGEISIAADTSSSKQGDTSLTIYHGSFSDADAADYLAKDVSSVTVTGSDGTSATVSVDAVISVSGTDSSGSVTTQVHALQKIAAQEATCTQDGNLEYYYCVYGCDTPYFTASSTTSADDNGDEISVTTYTASSLENVTIAATGHSYTSEITTAATCTTDGVMTYTCSVCGDSYTESIAATGHSYDEGVVTTPATCTTEGVITYTCANDSSHTYTESIDALKHTWGEWITVTEASCEEDGFAYRTCSVCGLSETSGIDATGHSWEDDYTIDQEASCTTDGAKSIHCSECDATKDSTVIPATGHSYDEGVVTTEAACTTEGVITYTCSVCGSTYTESILATGHSYGDPVWTWEAADDGYGASATFPCVNDSSHVVSMTATVSSVTAEGLVTYTAAVTGPDGETVYSDILEVEEAAETGADGEAADTADGEIIHSDDVSASAPDTGYEVDVDVLKENTLTGTEQETVDEGGKAEYTITVRTQEDKAVSEEDITLTESYLASDEVTAGYGDLTVGMYLDISLYLTVTDADGSVITDSRQITNTKSASYTITVTIPEDLVNMDSSVTRTYQILRVHDGTAQILDSTLGEGADGTLTLTFETNKFSTYAILYSDTAATEAETTAQTEDPEEEGAQIGDGEDEAVETEEEDTEEEETDAGDTESEESEEEDTESEELGSVDAADTGDPMNLFLWLAFLLMAGAAFMALKYAAGTKHS